jgi:hypothetical protein
MNTLKFFLLFTFISTSAFAQVVPKESNPTEVLPEDNDTLLEEPIQLQEVIIHKNKLDPQAQKEYLLLQNRVYKVYPYAKIASDRLMALNQNMDKLKTNREKRKYFKIAENYIENEFSDKLKKLSHKQGQILVKLIHRQTGVSTYELIKEHKSGWKAFWSNTTAKFFEINLKTIYAPYQVNEDFLIETILDRAFTNGRLVKQEPAVTVNIDELTDFWYAKAGK